MVQVPPSQLHTSLSHLPEDSEYLCHLEGVYKVPPSLKIPPAKPVGSCYPLLPALLRVRYPVHKVQAPKEVLLLFYWFPQTG